MARLCMITVPGLVVKHHWSRVHDRLLDEFPLVTDVLPTTKPGTLLIVYDGRAELDAWFQAMLQTTLGRHALAGKQSSA